MLLLSGFVLPCTVMIFCYSWVIYHVWFNSETTIATNTALLQLRRKLTNLFILVTITFIVTWTPTFETLFVDIREAWKFELFSIFVALLGSTAKPLISLREISTKRQTTSFLLLQKIGTVKRYMSLKANSFSLKEMKRTCSQAEIVLGYLPFTRENRKFQL